MSHAVENQDPVQCRRGLNLSSAAMLFFALFVSAALSACSGSSKSSDPPPNVGGGYTLKASGGTLTNSSGTNGLVVLATLRDSEGRGPGAAAGWQITITGPGINTPLTADYDDGSSSSYITWSWPATAPQTGTYIAKASNGATTLTYTFSIDASQSLYQPTLDKSGDVISWSPVTGAGSYYYQVRDGNNTLVTNGYLSKSLTSFVLPSLPDGSYLVQVYAHTKNRIELMADPSVAPVLTSQENVSVSGYSLVGGTDSGYYLNARGGVLYMGQYPSGTDHYGLAIWTSILTSATGTLPADDWTITVTGPGITGQTTFIYPKIKAHYLYWVYGVKPASGLYTVTATAPGYTLTSSFTIPNITAKLPVAGGLSASPTTGGGASATWAAVAGAGSYYVNVWTYVSGVYTEIAGGWVNTNAALIPEGTLSAGVAYDLYVTASSLDMTVNTALSSPSTQMDMSDTTFTYFTFTAQ